MRMKIGSFMKDTHGILHGKIYGLGLGVTSVLFEPQPDSQGGISFFSLVADPVLEAYEIGRAWEKKKSHLTWYSVLIDSPFFPASLNAALFPDMENPHQFNLVFDRTRNERTFSPISELFTNSMM